jgi:hypothetical protein
MLGAVPAVTKFQTQGGDMHSKYCESYHAFDVQVEIDAAERASFNGSERRFKVRWSVTRRHCNKGFSEVIGVFTEPVGFLSEEEALQYGEGRAHLMIDCMLKLQEGEGHPSGPTICAAPLRRQV